MEASTSPQETEWSSKLPNQAPTVHVIGGGLAGCEAALQLADLGHTVHLFDLKPNKTSPAHHNPNLAEIVCSNSFGSQGGGTASGLLKLEMEAMGCRLLQIAQEVSVPAGKALAVDRDAFAQKVTETVKQHPRIQFHGEEVHRLPTADEADYVILATGPLTSPALAEDLAKVLERDQLYFFDAASPIITKDSINFDIAFIQDRYALEKRESTVEPSETIPEDQGTQESYINCPMEKNEYLAFIEAVQQAERTPLKDFETATSGGAKANYFESCLPIEVLAERGKDTLRYGPMKPVGLIDPRTNRRPYAVVQLRQDNSEGTLYNLVGFQTNIKWGPQKEILHRIPGLENADIVRYGVMHRNTYLHSPEVLLPSLQVKKRPTLLVAGQLTGTEGYTESIACGLIAAMNVHQLINGDKPIVLPALTMLGSLLRYITREEAIGKSFQPMNSNWGILPPLGDSPEILKKAKREKPWRNQQYVSRSLQSLEQALKENRWPHQRREPSVSLV